MVQFATMRKILLSACLGTLAAAASPAQSTAANFSVPIVYRNLPNGLRVVVSENHASPTVIVALMYRIGFRIEPKDRTCFAHLFEHTMFQRSQHVRKFQ